MATLEAVALGDTVRVIQTIKYEWGKQKRFWINVEVMRVTSTQFTAGGSRYRKSNGTKLGGSGSAEPARQDGSDQSAELADFTQRCQRTVAARNTADRLEKGLSHDHPNMYEIAGLLAQAYALLGTQS